MIQCKSFDFTLPESSFSDKFRFPSVPTTDPVKEFEKLFPTIPRNDSLDLFILKKEVDKIQKKEKQKI